ncbi:rCG30377 [Rattus norvegicus]|uniref:RCG30377 n=1 Tax=Rattus norvegicus TaxID=10116 RepID=A6JF91_RAT|nr:rCG30377 [Rattus norvegicus]
MYSHCDELRSRKLGEKNGPSYYSQRPTGSSLSLSTSSHTLMSKASTTSQDSTAWLVANVRTHEFTGDISDSNSSSCIQRTTVVVEI